MKPAGLGSALLVVGVFAAWATWRVVASPPPGAEPNPLPDDPFLAWREVFVAWTDADGLQPASLKRTRSLVDRLRHIDGVETVLSPAPTEEAAALFQLPLLNALLARAAERQLLSADHTRSALVCKLRPRAADWPGTLSQVEQEVKDVYPDAALAGFPVLSLAARLETRRTAMMRAWGFVILLPLLVRTFATSRQAILLAAVGIAALAAGALAVLVLPPNVGDVAATLLPPLVTAAMLVAARRILGTTERPRSDASVRRRFGVNLLTAALLFVAALGIWRLQWQHGARRVVQPEHRLVADWDFIDRHFNGLRFDYVRIPVAASFTWTEYDRLHALEERLRGVGGVKNTAGVPELLRAFIVPASRLVPADRLLDYARNIMPEAVEHFRSRLPAKAHASEPSATIWSRVLIFYDPAADVGAVLGAHRNVAEICLAEFPDSHVEGLAVYESEQLRLARHALRVAVAGWVLLTAIVFRPWNRGPRAWLLAAAPGLVYFGGLGIWDGLMTNDRAAIGIWIGVVGFLLGRNAGWRWMGLTVFTVFVVGLVPVLLQTATVVEPVFGLFGLLAAILISEPADSGR